MECYFWRSGQSKVAPGKSVGVSSGSRQGKFEGQDRKVLPIGSVLLSELCELLANRRAAAQTQVKSEVKGYLGDKSYDYVF